MLISQCTSTGCQLINTINYLYTSWLSNKNNLWLSKPAFLATFFSYKTANQSCMKYTVYCTVYLTVNTSDILKALIFKLLFLSIPSFKICLFCPDHRNILRLVRKEWSQIPGSGARMPCVEHTVHCTGSRFGTKQVSRIFF